MSFFNKIYKSTWANFSKYIIHRKKGLIEMRKLVYDRDILNRNIRKVKKELTAWDNNLISN